MTGIKANKNISEQDANLLTMFSFPDSFPLFINVKEIIDQKLTKPILFMPYGLGFKIAGQSDRSLTSKQFINIQRRIWQNFNLNDEEFRKSVTSLGFHMLDIQEQYAKSAVHTGDYLVIYYGDINAAKEWYEKALNFYPEEDAYKGLGYYYYEKHECKISEEYVNKIISVNPKNKLAFKQLYLLYKNCYKDDKKAENIKKNIKEKFKVEI